MHCGNVAKLGHPTQHVLLPLLGAVRIGDRVVERRRFGQTGKHRDLAEVQLIERFAEVRLRGRAETVGALAEVNLVDIELEDFLLVQAVLDLEGEQRLVELARKRLFRGEKEVARHLHRDRARPLAAAAGDQVGIGGAQHPDVVDAGVLVKALVLGGDDGVLEERRHIRDGDHRPAFFAEFADQRSFGRIDPQRDLRLVGGERVELREVRIREHDNESQHQHGSRRHAGGERQRKAEKSKPHREVRLSKPRYCMRPNDRRIIPGTLRGLIN